MVQSSDYYNPEYNGAESEPARQEATRPSQATAEPKNAPEPAKRRTPRKPASPTRKADRGYGPIAFFTDRRLRLFLGVVCLLMAAFALVSTVSWLVSGHVDQAKITYNTSGQIVALGDKVANAGGPVGAMLGNFLLTESLGLGSLILIFYVGALGLRLIGQWHFKFWPMTFKCLLVSVSMSVVLGLLTFNNAGFIMWGGYHGHYINQLLIDYSSALGAICVSIALVALVATLYLTELTRLYMAYRRRINAIRERRAAEEERRARERAAVEAEMQTPAPVDETDEEEQRPEPATESENSDPLEFTDMPAEEQDLPDADDSDSLIGEPDSLIGEPETEISSVLTDNSDSPFQVTAHEIEEAEVITTDTFDPTAELYNYHFPSIELLEDRAGNKVTIDTEEQEANKERIIKALEQFNIKISSIKATVGPTITLFEVVPAEGQRIAAIKRVEEDLALALKAQGIRIIAPIPGKGTIGIEVPNNDPQVVSMRSIIASRKFQESQYELPMAMGATISNEVFIADLAKMPHLLVAGATGQGKSVGLNAIITSLLYKKHPAELKFVLIDPKMVEFSLYRVLERHYLAKLPDEDDAVITDYNKVVATLNSLCVEMDRRYALLSMAGCRNVKEYNQKFIAKQLNPGKGHRFMPYIVLIVDEFADLIMTAGKEIESPICRLAQKARAIGIHAIIATQRPSTNVITGLIKANFPGRIAFRVSQMVDSKTILDRSGAHQLVGKGDMFFSTNGNLERVQCAFVDTPEVEAICQSIADQPGYANAYELPEYVPDVPEGGAASAGQPGSSFDRDPLFEEAARFIVSSGTSSTSSLQRRYSIGYNRAGKIMDQLEASGVVGPASGMKPRAILMDMMDLDQMFS